ncbi:MAG TPA: FtsX-like permease family protein [Opitutaceae bacterium]|jgi:putative ABC transport system permease protein|nr:MAG: FtsX-like permease family protein [Verrucomicrobia bacterium ADurb.Bin122]HOF10542.1 FtsX-like permease family protein [Opitutaceae bacterium]HOR25403.1 FtsX-like permease family protein [Opitutaceae bacterium]HPK49826.1 FtsX-like permease family protein [Opitutaceae bacterium]
MTLSGFVIKNAFRNKRRAALSVLSVAASLFLLVALQVVLNEFSNPPEDVGTALRIAVRNKVSIASPLPVRQRALIEKIPGVEAVTPLTFFGGNYKGEDNTFFAQFATDPDALMGVFGEALISPDRLDAWKKDRTGAIIGLDTAKRYNLKPGDRLPLVGQYYPVDLDLTVTGIYEGTSDDRNVWFHQKYLDELLGDPGTVGMWWVKARSADDVPRIIDQVNAAFANTSAEVVAETERAFQMGFVSMWANIKVLISSICSVVVFALLLVTASTMSMAVRERMRELAVLKALGFRRHELFAFILAESFGLSAVGLLLGAGGAWLISANIDAPTLTGGLFPMLTVTPRILGTAALVAVLLGIVSSLAPAISVARMSVVEGLKTLD